MKRHFIILSFLLCSICSVVLAAKKSSVAQRSDFWYDTPAKVWTSSLPIGNGRIGGLVFGDVDNEEIVLNENSIWVGPPVPPNNPTGPKAIAAMRERLLKGDFIGADSICNKDFMMPEWNRGMTRSYNPFGFLRMNFDYSSTSADKKGYAPTTNYCRWMDYANAIAYLAYTKGGVNYRRESFVSAPDQVLVMRLTADKKKSITFRASFFRERDALCIASGKDLRIKGQAKADGHYSDPANANEYNGTKFDGIVRFENKGGRVVASDSAIYVEGADEVTVYIAIQTDYNFKDPINHPLVYDRTAKCVAQLDAAHKKGYDAILRDHVNEYHGLYNRSSINIDLPSKNDIPVDKRIKACANGSDDPELLMLYYRYCRYVFISSSRKGGLPSNLQCIWNPLMLAPWKSNYHINVNEQINYWFAEQANLSDCHEPLFDLTEELCKNGKETARIQLGIPHGSVAGIRTDAWHYTTIIGGQSCHGMYVLGLTWLAQHMMEHYRFTLDRQFLQERAYPVLRECALFFKDWLVKEPSTGKLVSMPSASAENSFIFKGKRCSVDIGPSQDQEMIWNAFRDYIEASEVLGYMNEEVKDMENAMKNLRMPKIGSDGRLMEWSQEFQETDKGHRHLSHLWGMMPGNRITQDKTPELVEAVRKSLHCRLDNDYKAQGWSLGWCSCMLARLREGDRAEDLMEHLYFAKSYDNMFVDAHGRVQIGDMMGTSLGIIELLLQSHTDYIDLLPALPKKWATGEVKNLCARGAFEVSMKWKDGKLVEANVHSRRGGKCRLRYSGKVQTFSMQPNETITVTGSSFKD